MRRWKIFLPVALILCLILMMLSPHVPTAKLPDGSVLEVASVTFGTNHYYSSSPRWQRVLRDIVPKRWRNLTGAPRPRHAVNSLTDCAVIWLRCFEPRSRTYRSLQGWTWHIVDKHGCTFPASWTRSGSKNHPIAWVTATTFPRRQGTFKLVGRLDSEMVSIDVRNSNPSRPAEWRPEVLPATRRMGDVELSLTGFEGQFLSNTFLSFRPKFEFKPNGPSDADEFKAESIFMDVTGNRARQLCPFEPAWKIEATVFPGALADFKSDEIIHLGKVKTPRPAETATVELSHGARALGIFFAGFTGAGQFTLSNSVWAEASAVAARPNYSDYGSSANSSDRRRKYWRREMRVYRPTLWLVSSNGNSLENYLVRALGGDGRIYPDRNNSRQFSQEDWVYFRNSFFALPDDAGEIELQLVPFQSRRVEFLVPPPMARKANY